MGRGKDRFKKKKHNSRNDENDKGDMRDRGSGKQKFDLIEGERTNVLFERYYQRLGVCKTDEEWSEFMACLQKMLPTTFRLTSCASGEAEALKAILEKEYLTELRRSDIRVDDVAIDAPSCIEWYPRGLAYQINIDKTTMRRCAQFRRIHEFLVSEVDSGFVSRQEVVSMLPPILLDVQPHHKVLDMCAAPGSKTAQLVEAIHASGNARPSGFVIANDADNKRCYLMTHQIKRLHSANCVIVNQEGQQFPYLYSGEQDATVMLFDRVLCDVPCSGDGTLRKNYDIWLKWSQSNAFHLHKTQCDILMRGLELLAPGGTLVYSTCSLNPIENEAVVAGVISKCSTAAVQIIDQSHLLDGKFKSQAGLSTWEVMNTQGDAFYTEFSQVPSQYTSIQPTMFPPSNVDEIELKHCLRILPHYQNSGGFFVAVLKKSTLLPWQNSKKFCLYRKGEEARTDLDGDDIAEETGQSKSEQRPPPMNKKLKATTFCGFREDPFVFLTEDDDCVPKIRKYFGILDSFDIKCLIARSDKGCPRRNLSVTSVELRQIIEANKHRLKMIHIGVRVIAKSECTSDIEFRLAREGAAVMVDYVTRVCRIHSTDIKKLLMNENTKISDLDSETRQRLKDFSQGSLLLQYEPSAECNIPACPLIIAGWLGTEVLRAFVPENQRCHLLRLCGTHVEVRAWKQYKEYANITAAADRKEVCSTTTALQPQSADCD